MSSAFLSFYHFLFLLKIADIALKKQTEHNGSFILHVEILFVIIKRLASKPNVHVHGEKVIM